MKTLLQVNSSILGNEGQSTRLADVFVAELGADTVIVRDLARASIRPLVPAYA